MSSATPHHEILKAESLPSHRYEVSEIAGSSVVMPAGTAGASNARVHWVSVNAASAPSFGGTTDFTLSGMNDFFVRKLGVEIDLSALTVGTLAGGASFAWETRRIVQRVDIYMNGGSSLIQTIEFEGRDIVRALHESDETEAQYAAIADAATAAGTFFLPIHSILDSIPGGIPLWLTSGDMRVRITWSPFVLGQGSAFSTDHTSGLPVGTIDAARLRVQVSDPSADDREHLAAVHQNNVSYRGLVAQVQRFSISAGATQLDERLGGVTGVISHVVAFLKDSTLTNGEDLPSSGGIAYTDFEIRDGGGKPIAGNEPIPQRFNRFQRLMSGWQSSNSAADNLAVYSWSDSPEISLKQGVQRGYRVFDGSERFRMNFPALANASELVVVAYEFGLLELASDGKVSMLL